MTPIRWTEQAVQDMRSIRQFIERDSPRYGRLVVERLFEATILLEDFPRAGRIVPEIALETTTVLRHPGASLSERKRLIREGLVIVVSILLAFAIDAGWDELQDRADEREVLLALLHEFEANLQEAVGTIASHERNSRLIALAHARAPSETALLDPDSAAATLAALAAPRTFDAIRGSLDALIGSGRLELIRDPELRRALAIFLNLVDDSAEDAAYLSEGSRRVWDRQISVGGPWRIEAADLTAEGCDAPVAPSSCFIETQEWAYLPQATPADLVAALEDEELMGQVRQLQINVSRYLAEVRRIERQAQTIISLLQDNLS